MSYPPFDEEAFKGAYLIPPSAMSLLTARSTMFDNLDEKWAEYRRLAASINWREAFDQRGPDFWPRPLHDEWRAVCFRGGGE